MCLDAELTMAGWGSGKLNSSLFNSRYVHASSSFTISKRVSWREKRALRTRLLEQ